MTPAAETPTEYPAPDWQDSQTQAEIAAQVQHELEEEFDEDDPYGMLTFDGHFDTDDEEGLRKEMSRYKLGRWLDGVVDSFLKLEDVEPDPEIQPVKRLHDNASVLSDSSVEEPPEMPKGVWDDVAWFGRLVMKTVRS